MDLWIRSQDREVLTKVIDIYKQADTNEIWAYSDRVIKNCLGFYETKERALEVLDEIQDYIENRCSTKLINDINSITYETTTRGNVYEMPKE